MPPSFVMQSPISKRHWQLVVYDAVMPKLATSGKVRAQTPIRMLQSMDTREGKFAPAQVELYTARIKGC